MSEISIPPRLPAEGQGRESLASWGLYSLIATEGILFVYLIFTYAYLGLQSANAWPPQGPPSLRLALPDTVLLLASSLVLIWGQRAMEQQRNEQMLRIALLATILMGAAFVAVQLTEWRAKPFHFSSDAYSAVYFTLTGTHMAHVVAGLLALTALLIWSLLGWLDPRQAHLRVGALYWHFVDAVWLAVFTTIYLVPRVTS